VKIWTKYDSLVFWGPHHPVEVPFARQANKCLKRSFHMSNSLS